MTILAISGGAIAIHGLCDPLPRRELHDWGHYGGAKLAAAPFVQELLGSKLRSWVESPGIANPLQIDWVWTLYAGAADLLESKLLEWRRQIGEDNLRGTISELPITSKCASEIGKKLASVAEELQVCRLLLESGEAPSRWRGSFADWNAAGTIVSMKAPLSMDFNSQVLDDALVGAYSVEENRVLPSSANHIQVSEATDIGDRFRESLVTFFDDGLADAIESTWTTGAFGGVRRASAIQNSVTWERGESRLAVRVEEAHRRAIALALSDDSAHQRKQGKLRARFSHDPEANGMLVVHFPDDTWWGAPSPCTVGLERKIVKAAERLQLNYEGAGGSKDFVGWLSIAVHPQHELYAAQSVDALERFMRRCVGRRAFEVVVLLHGGWSLAKPRLIRITP